MEQARTRSILLSRGSQSRAVSPDVTSGLFLCPESEGANTNWADQFRAHGEAMLHDCGFHMHGLMPYKEDLVFTRIEGACAAYLSQARDYGKAAQSLYLRITWFNGAHSDAFKRLTPADFVYLTRPGRSNEDLYYWIKGESNGNH